MAELPFTEG